MGKEISIRNLQKIKKRKTFLKINRTYDSYNWNNKQVNCERCLSRKIYVPINKLMWEDIWIQFSSMTNEFRSWLHGLAKRLINTSTYSARCCSRSRIRGDSQDLRFQKRCDIFARLIIGRRPSKSSHFSPTTHRWVTRDVIMHFIPLTYAIYRRLAIEFQNNRSCKSDPSVFPYFLLVILFSL